MIEPVIRPTAAADFPILKELLYEAIFQEPGNPKLPFDVIQTPEIWNYLDGFGEKPDDLGWVAEFDGKVIGAAWSRILDVPIRGYGSLDAETPELAMAIFPEYRGLGIGTRLLNALLTDCRERQYRQISLSVDKRNPAIRLYQRAGFAVVDEKEQDCIMARYLPDDSFQKKKEVVTQADLEAVLALLDALPMRYWLDGGWGVDVLCGRQNRVHRDIDIDFDAAFTDILLEALLKMGYVLETDWRPCRMELYHSQRGFLDIHPLEIAADGTAKQDDRHGGWYHFDADFFSAASFAGRTIPCISLKAQLLFHSGYDLRDKDRFDLNLLNAIRSGSRLTMEL